MNEWMDGRCVCYESCTERGSWLSEENGGFIRQTSQPTLAIDSLNSACSFSFCALFAALCLCVT